uniref:Si:ch211-110p13.9 n=1 Tax=Labrus bergylta TaxID=56723 RepID=A0A3Q3FEY3_9LABR
PLYLGADLFSNTDIRTENHPRHHAKFAKKGLATKIHFSSAFRFHGLKVPTVNNSLWFYSIQGLFRVAFEMYSKQEQLAVLENFQSKQTLHTEPRSRDVSTVRRKLQDLHDKLSESPADYLETILLLLETVNQCMSGNLEEKDVKEAVLALLKAKDWGGVYSSPLLCCVGRWLGQQFHAANSSISHKVEGFKVHHIERISDLPPAEELTTELFPEAMRTLLLHWMGLSDESTLEKRRSEYPILLLILEFANHNLITGVAHVLYSSLICK